MQALVAQACEPGGAIGEARVLHERAWHGRAETASRSCRGVGGISPGVCMYIHTSGEPVTALP